MSRVTEKTLKTLMKKSRIWIKGSTTLSKKCTTDSRRVKVRKRPSTLIDEATRYTPEELEKISAARDAEVKRKLQEEHDKAKQQEVNFSLNSLAPGPNGILLMDAEGNELLRATQDQEVSFGFDYDGNVERALPPRPEEVFLGIRS